MLDERTRQRPSTDHGQRHDQHLGPRQEAEPRDAARSRRGCRKPPSFSAATPEPQGEHEGAERQAVAQRVVPDRHRQRQEHEAERGQVGDRGSKSASSG